jgi:hypothetical protein
MRYQEQPTEVLKEINNTHRIGDGVFLMQDIEASNYVHENIDNPLASSL